MPTGPSPAVLRDLLERVRATKGPDRTLDVRLLATLKQLGQWSEADIEYACTDPGRTCDPPAYTASIDAALALVEGMLPDRRTHFNITSGGTLEGRAALSVERTAEEASAHLMKPDPDPEDGFGGYLMEGNLHCGANAPLAILAALLSAKLALLTQDAPDAE